MCIVGNLGCSVHLLILLVDGLNIPNMKDQILFIVNFFRYNHFASRKVGGNRLVVPQEVHQNKCQTIYQHT